MKNLIAIIALCIVVSIPLRAQWAQCNGPHSGDISCLAISGNSIFAGTTSSGIYISTNNGNQWKEINSGLNDKIIYSLIAKGNALYASTNRGVYLSDNNGTTWNKPASTLANTSIYALAFRESSLLAGTGTGIFSSADNGKSWANIGLKDRLIYCVATDSLTIYAGTDRGVFLSTDNGNTWLSNGFPAETVLSLSTNGIYIYAGTSGGGLFISNNSGRTWKSFDIGLNDKFIFSLANNGSEIYAGTGRGVYSSTNNGANWTQKGLNDFRITALAPTGNQIWAGTNGFGIYLSGSDWTNQGLPVLSVYALATKIFDTTNVPKEHILAGTSQGIYYSSNNGNTWQRSSLKDGFIKSIAISQENIFAAAEMDGVFRSNNQGINWRAVNNGLKNTSVYTLAAGAKYIFAGTENGIYASENNGEQWIQLNDLRQPITFLSARGSELFAISTGQLYYSADEGKTWSAKLNGLVDVSINIISINGADLFVGTENNGVLRSEDNGQTWKSRGLENTSIYSLVMKNNTLYAVTNKGIFISPYNGGEWQNLNSGLENNTTLSIAAGTQFIFAGTPKSSVFRFPLNSTTIGMDRSLEKQTLTLYPNPAQDNLSIAIPSDFAALNSPVNYSILNQQGQQVFYTQSHTLSTIIPINNLPAGSYTVIARCGTQFRAERITILR